MGYTGFVQIMTSKIQRPFKDRSYIKCMTRTTDYDVKTPKDSNRTLTIFLMQGRIQFMARRGRKPPTQPSSVFSYR